MKYSLCPMLAIFSACLSANAEVIAHYFDGSNSYANQASTYVTAGTVTGTTREGEGGRSLQLASSYTYPPAHEDVFGNVGNGRGNNWFHFSNYDLLQNSPDNYLSFSLTSNSSSGLLLDTLSFQYAFTNDDWPQTASYTYEIYCDLFDGNGFQLVGKEVFYEYEENPNGFYAPDNNILSQKLMLGARNNSDGSLIDPRSAIELSSLTGIMQADFRVNFYRNGGNHTPSKGILISDLMVDDGLTPEPIPEPSTAALGLFGMMALAFRRRK